MKIRQLNELFSSYYDGDTYSRLSSMAQIRDLVIRVDVRDMMGYIENMTEPKYLNILLGCGMRGTLWMSVIKQKAKLEGV